MNLSLLFIALFQVQVVLTQAPDEMVAYVGETVTLLSGAQSPLSKILWSIYSNTTFIARYQNTKTYTELFPRYRNRLSLNKATGDLTIHDVRAQDSLVYKAEIYQQSNISERQISLKVRQPLPEPTIEKTFSLLTKESRVVVLKCSSAEEDVEFSWDVTLPLITKCSRSPGSPGSPGELVAVYNRSLGSAWFTCFTSRDKETTSRDYPDIIDGEPELGPPESKISNYLVAFLSVVICAIVICLSLCKQKIHRRTYEMRHKRRRSPSAGADAQEPLDEVQLRVDVTDEGTVPMVRSSVGEPCVKLSSGFDV